MAVYTLGKDERLKSRKQIQLLFSQGKSFSQPPFRVYYALDNDVVNNNSEKSTAPTRMGVGVSTRNFKHATDRNRIKRLVRESWRLQKLELNELLKQQGRQMSVFFIYTSREMSDFQSIHKTMSSAIHKLKRLQEKAGS